MQAFEDIISRLTELQKLRLLTDPASVPPSDLGLPAGSTSFIELNAPEVNGFPSASVMSRGFDAELAEGLAAGIGGEVYHLVLPSARGAIGKRNGSISEDPFLSGMLAASYLKGAERAGAAAYLDGYGTCGESLPHRYHFSDRVDHNVASPSPRAVFDQLIRPFGLAMSSAHCSGVISELDTPKNDLQAPLICRPETDADTVKAVSQGRICFGGSTVALQKALLNYRELQSMIDQGRLSSAELSDAVKKGEALSDKALDEAVVKVIELLSYPARAAKARFADRERLRRRALLESTVLLRNEHKLLPMSAPTTLCTIGGILSLSGETNEELSAIFGNAGHKFISHAAGYSLTGERDDTLMRQACDLARSADTVIVCLGTDKTRHIGSLPANQVALCRELQKLSKKLIYIISCDHSVELSPLKSAQTTLDALLLAPLNIRGAFRSALEVILGQSAPEGRLSEGFYDEAALKTAKRGLAEGPFLGYRFTDTVGGVGTYYPFGHGLSYTEFHYSQLHTTSNSVTFTVKNRGARAGVEIAQVYIGMEGSAILRPKKELCGFCRLELAPNESRTVTLPLVLPPAPEYRIEAGKYTVYVGASVADIRLSRSLTLGGTAVEPDREPICRYLPTRGNILEEHYTLEAEHIHMKATYRSLIFGISALVLAVGLKIYDVVTLQHSLFLNMVAILLTLGAALFFVLEGLDRKKQLKQQQEELDRANAELFKDAEYIKNAGADQLFKAEEPPKERATETHSKLEEVEYDYYADIDKSITFGSAISDLVRFAAENGVVLTERMAAEIFAAFAASRVIIVNGMNDDSFAWLCYIIGSYFGCPAAIDTVNESYYNEIDVIFDRSNYGSVTQRNAFTVLQQATADPKNIHPAFFGNVTPAELPKYFAPYAKYARSPRHRHTIPLLDSLGNEVQYRIPANIWFVMNLREGEPLSSLPDYLTEIASVHTWQLEFSGQTAPISPFAPFRYGQLIYLTEKAAETPNIDENIWKKIDRLAAYAAQFTDYRVGNKLTVELETYISVLSAAEPDSHDILDRALSAKLVPSLIEALDGKLPREATGLAATLDNIFGDGKTNACRKLIKKSGAANI